MSENSFTQQNSILFREKEVNFLTRFFEKSFFRDRFLFIYGRNATGKTLVLSKLLKHLSKKFVWIDCYEYDSDVLIFTAIIRHLSKIDDPKKVTNICQFINSLKEELKDSTETVYLVFDNVEVLRKSSMIQLTMLQKLTKVKICSIFVSRLSWEEFIDQNTTINPISVFFSNYSKSEMCALLSLDCPPDCKQAFYSGYVNVVLKTFYTAVRNLSELRQIAQANFAKYCEPLYEDPLKEPGLMRLWKNIEPTLKLALDHMYLREAPGSIWRAFKESNKKNNGLFLNSVDPTLTRELSCLSKFLLIAMYFASFNPHQSDFKHFVKNQGKQAKKKVKKRLGKNRHLLGPKPFALDRMMSIFYSMVGKRILPSGLICSQISSLVNHQLVSRVSVDDKLDDCTYKCLVDLELICRIGKTLGIDVMGYLDDFL